MTDQEQPAPEPAEISAEDLIKAAFTQSFGLISPGIIQAARALKLAREKGLAVCVTATFMPDGKVLVLEPAIIAPKQEPEGSAQEQSEGAAA